MTASDHVRITGPEDILGFIPHSLGYWPENSLVAMTLQGKRLGATLRVDLPEPGGASGGRRGGGGGGGGGDPAAGAPGRAVSRRRARAGRRDTLAGFARHVVSYLQADDAADGSLLALFTDADIDGDTATATDGASATDTATVGERPRGAWAGLLKELELALEAAGMPLRDAWIIGPEFWRNAYCSDPECCGSPGRPVEQIRNSRLNAEMVFRGSLVGAAPDARASRPASRSVDPAVHAAEAGWMEQFSPRRRDSAQFAQVLDVWSMVLRSANTPERPPGLAPDAPAPAPEAGTHRERARADGTSAERAGDPGASAERASDPGAGDPGTGADGVGAPATMDWPLELPPELAGYLRASLCIASWRDALLVMAAAGRPAAERGAEEFGIFDTDSGSGPHPVSRPGPTRSPLPGQAVPVPAFPGPGPGPDPGPGAGAGAGAVPGYGEVLLGLAPSVPDWSLMVRLERVLELLGGLGAGESTAAAVTARGWIEWCRGRGSYADALYRQALEGHPGYRLAELLAELGRRGTLCGWAARREAAWQKFAPDAA
jgi:hypothetical protein